MKTKNLKVRASLILSLSTAVLAACSASQAQTVIGSPGAGFQTWKVANLNNNKAPFWDAPTRSVEPFNTNPDSKNVGYCLTAGGDCVGLNSQVSAPGPLPYWGMPFDSSTDTNGKLDHKVYFKRDTARTFKATLQLQLTTVPTQVNEFGWFETNAAGTVVGVKHLLFKGGAVTPAPVGANVLFKPTAYFGYYFGDVSEGNCPVYTITSFNGSSCPDHNIVVFATKPSSPNSTFWIAGEDPAGCADDDCNLTLVKVAPVSH